MVQVVCRRTTSPLKAIYNRTDTGAEVVLKHPVKIREYWLEKRDSLTIQAYCKIDVKHSFLSDMSV